MIKKVNFQHLSVFDWSNSIWYKGFDINLSLFAGWLTMRGLKPLICFISVVWAIIWIVIFILLNQECINTCFFQCPFSWNLIRQLLPNGDFFMLEPSLHQVLFQDNSLGHKIIKRIYLLIISVIIHWRSAMRKESATRLDLWFLIKWWDENLKALGHWRSRLFGTIGTIYSWTNLLFSCWWIWLSALKLALFYLRLFLFCWVVFGEFDSGISS